MLIYTVACALSFIALVFSIALLCRPSVGTRISSGVTLAAALLAALITTIVFLIDVIAVAVVRREIRDATEGDVTGSYGNAVRF